MYKIILTIGILLSVISTASAGQYDYVIPPENLWSCFDYSMDFSRNNPDWGIVLISTHPQFRGMGNSHFVNYQIVGDSLLVRENDSDWEYLIDKWQYDTCTFEYYHFYVNGEIPTRYFKYKLPNAEAMFNAL